jgi:hypothetical protein
LFFVVCFIARSDLYDSCHKAGLCSHLRIAIALVICHSTATCMFPSKHTHTHTHTHSGFSDHFDTFMLARTIPGIILRSPSWQRRTGLNHTISTIRLHIAWPHSLFCAVHCCVDNAALSPFAAFAQADCANNGRRFSTAQYHRNKHFQAAIVISP